MDFAKVKSITLMSRDNRRYASRGNYDNVLQRILPTTVPWFTSNRFARKSNYLRGEYAEKPRIKKHWDLRKISARYKSRPPRNLLFLVPISHSSITAAIDRNRHGLSRETNAYARLVIVHLSHDRKNNLKPLWEENSATISIWSDYVSIVIIFCHVELSWTVWFCQGPKFEQQLAYWSNKDKQNKSWQVDVSIKYVSNILPSLMPITVVLYNTYN